MTTVIYLLPLGQMRRVGVCFYPKNRYFLEWTELLQHGFLVFACKQMVPAVPQQWMFCEPSSRKFTKSRFRYYRNTEASFKVELNPRLSTKWQDSGSSRADFSSFHHIPIHPNQRAVSYHPFNQPYRSLFQHSNPANLISIPRVQCLSTSQRPASTNLQFCLLNTRLIRNKVMRIILKLVPCVLQDIDFCMFQGPVPLVAVLELSSRMVFK